jgi:hypothetical protein
MSEYFGRDQRAGHERLSDQHTIVAVDQPDLLQLDR